MRLDIQRLTIGETDVGYLSMHAPSYLLSIATSVMVQVKSIAEMGAYVSLLEYNGIEGMILLSELSRRRIRSITKLIKASSEGDLAHIAAMHADFDPSRRLGDKNQSWCCA